MAKEAENREARATWRAKRVALNSERMEFWREEKKRLQDQLSAIPDSSLENTEKHRNKGSLDEERVRLVQDEMNNFRLAVEDKEGNLVAEGSVEGLLDCLSGEARQIVSNCESNFSSLPSWLKTQMVSFIKKKPLKSEAKTSSQVANISESQLSKWKRPDNFKESLQKKNEVQKSSFWSPKEDVDNYTESLGSALTVGEPGEVVRRKKRGRQRGEVTSIIDGRKRPVSKTIEEVLYPSR